MSVVLRGPDLRDDKGVYRYDGGREYPGITRCLSPYGSWEYVWKDAVDKDAKRLADAFDNGEYMTGWRELEPGVWRQVDVSPVDYLRHDLSNSGARQMKAYKDRGTVLHSLLEDFAAGCHVEQADAGEWLENRIYGSRMACSVDDCLGPARGIIRWCDEYQPLFHVSECPAFNDTARVAGKPDGLISCDKLGAGMFWVDLKPGFDRSHIRQLSGYSHMEFFVYGEEGKGFAEYPVPQGLPALVLQYETGTSKIGHRFVDANLLEQHWITGMLPAINAYWGNVLDEAPLPKNKAVWLKEK